MYKHSCITGTHSSPLMYNTDTCITAHNTHVTPNESQAIAFGKHGGLFFNNGSRTYVVWDIHSLR